MWSDWNAIRRFELTMTFILLALVAMTFIAPYTLPYGSVPDLSGRIGYIDNAKAISQMNPFAQAVYYVGDLNCHQIIERSFSLNGNEMPICSRDLGIFIGMTLTMALLALTSFRPKFYMILLLAMPMIIDGGFQAISDYESNNLLRVCTGLIGGAAVAFFVAMIAFEVLTIKTDKKTAPDR
jgi:uncharacterized membrane protein